MPMNENEWFEDWFDSPYYHILYRHRDTDEAEAFLSGLIKDIPMTPGSSVLDVACGRGRHAIYLNRQGFDVNGFDLSEQNTLHNLEFENDRLRFFRHDMRDVFCVNCFDYVVNLFSSFGADLPTPTLVVMSISDWTVANWYILFPAMGGAVQLRAYVKERMRYAVLDFVRIRSEKQAAERLTVLPAIPSSQARTATRLRAGTA